VVLDILEEGVGVLDNMLHEEDNLVHNLVLEREHIVGVGLPLLPLLLIYYYYSFGLLF
jgi:hypothetical protein